MYTLKKSFTFEASHQLVHHDGKCQRMHGHSYLLTIEVKGSMITSGPQANMVIDYGDISVVGKGLVDLLDHRHLNEIFGEDMPTAEYIAKWAYDYAAGFLPSLWAIEVCETASSACRYSPAEERLYELGAIELNRLRQRIYSKIDIKGADECWPFKGSRDVEGYGYCSSRIAGTNKAHRLVLWLEGHEIAGKPILHSCDNPPCCNPAHLRVGTHAENENDKDSRGRRPFGEASALAKMTEADVIMLWSDYNSIPSSAGFERKWGAMLGVTPNAIVNILTGWSWNHITKLPKRFKGRPSKGAKEV